MPGLTKHLFLVGLPGVGKTTIGQVLAARLGVPYVDLDDIIVQREGKAISDVFAEEGEDYFREVEAACLRSAAEEKLLQIISTGGGTPCFFNNMEYMNQVGTTCYLETSWPTLARRVGPGQTVRPLFKGLEAGDIEEQLRNRFSWRIPFYEKSTVHIQTNQKSPAELGDEILRQL